MHRLRSLPFASVGVLLGFAAIGCGEPPPIIPRGAVFIGFSDTGADCAVMSHNLAIGEVNASAKLALLEDGATSGGATATIECKVTGGPSGPFNVDATAKLSDKNVLFAIDQLPIDATEQDPFPGALAMTDVITADPYSASPADPMTSCEFYFGPEQDATPGSVWASFKCSAIVAQMSTCGITQGFLAFENCLAE